MSIDIVFVIRVKNRLAECDHWLVVICHCGVVYIYENPLASFRLRVGLLQVVVSGAEDLPIFNVICATFFSWNLVVNSNFNTVLFPLTTDSTPIIVFFQNSLLICLRYEANQCLDRC